MKPRSLFFARLLLPAALISFASSVHAAAIIWDNGGADLLWSNTVNWSPDSAPAGNDITFDATAASTTAGTVTNTVDASVSINSLTYNNVGANTHTTQINAGQTLTIAGAIGTAFNVNTTGAGSSNVTINGAGTLALTGGQVSTSFNVGSVVFGAGGTTQVLNMGGLANFSASVATFSIGNGQRGAGTVTLGTTNSITANALLLGGNTTTGGNLSTLNLGQTNTINATTMTSGSGRSSGNINFAATGLTGTPTVVIRGTAGGVTRAAVNIGNVGNVSASGVGSGIIDFSGGSVDALFSTVNIGQGANSTGSGSSTSSLTMGLGTIDATTITAGIGSTATGTANTGTGTITLNANAGTLTAGTLILGNQTNTGGTVTSNAVGAVNQNGGIAAITTLTLANRTATGAANVTGSYNLATGTLKAQNIQAGANGTGAGTATRNFNWTGGTIQNLNSATDLTIASTNGLALTLTGAGTQKFTVDSGRTITVNAGLTGNGGFTKDGLGTLILSASNTYTGATTVSSGTLTLTNAGSMGDASTLNFDTSSVINLNFTGSDTLFSIANTGGLTLAGTGTYTAADLNTFFSVNSFAGTGTFTLAVPEPSAAILSGLGCLALLRRRRA